jgi:APA family basic amino acid/polyamine antiporter
VTAPGLERGGDSGEPDRHPRDRLARALTLADATGLVVASVIGSGIFLTPGRIAELLPRAGLVLGVWATGALLSLAGALANAELGAMYPHAGGDYVYVREAFHPAAGFLVGWLSFFVIYAGTIATLAAGFAGGLGQLAGIGDAAQLALAVVLVIACSALNYVGVRWGARANNLTTLVKVASLVVFAAAGFASGHGELGHLAGPAPKAPVALWAFGLALSPVLFSYLGWNASIYVASEIRDPTRNVPRSLFLGLGLCAAIYLLMNVLYLYAVPVDAQRGIANAGEASARVLFGAAGGTLVALLVLWSILGTLNATILVGPRIAYAMALDGLFFAGVDQAHATFRTPSVAIAFQAAAAIAILLLLRSFPSALDYTTFAIVLATMADVAALYALRRRQPDRARPYRAWGYPWVPALYVVANLLIAGIMLWERPRECGIGLVILAAGFPFYAAFGRSRSRAA